MVYHVVSGYDAVSWHFLKMETTMDYSNFSQPWEEKTATTTRIPVRANARFFFAHNPENWELKIYRTQIQEGKKKKSVEIPMLLPVLS